MSAHPPSHDTPAWRLCAACPCAGVSIPNPLKLLSALRPRSLVSLAQGQGKRVQRLVWRLEDASAFTAKFAAKAVVKGVRPALVCE